MKFMWKNWLAHRKWCVCVTNPKNCYRWKLKFEDNKSIYPHFDHYFLVNFILLQFFASLKKIKSEHGVSNGWHFYIKLSHMYSSLHTFTWYKYLLWVSFFHYLLGASIHTLSLSLRWRVAATTASSSVATIYKHFRFRTQEMKNITGKQGNSHGRANARARSTVVSRWVSVCERARERDRKTECTGVCMWATRRATETEIARKGMSKSNKWVNAISVYFKWTFRNIGMQSLWICKFCIHKVTQYLMWTPTVYEIMGLTMHIYDWESAHKVRPS